ncbi:PREDICTED: protein FAM19A5-like, partial [Phaethon lepturus]|uniref:protein FAM19A5-like n=1 Tax=Phaethon lepturus TaxID=97097 RepID=UPI0005308FB9
MPSLRKGAAILCYTGDANLGNGDDPVPSRAVPMDPKCNPARIIKTKQWCEMLPCLEGEGCDLLINKSGWTCTQPGGRIKTTT